MSMYHCANALRVCLVGCDFPVVCPASGYGCEVALQGFCEGCNINIAKA